MYIFPKNFYGIVIFNLPTSGYDIMSKIVTLVTVKLRHTDPQKRQDVLDEAKVVSHSQRSFVLIIVHAVWARQAGLTQVCSYIG